MNVDTGQWAAITADRDRLRSDVAALVRVTAGAVRVLDALGCPPVPVLTVVAGTGRGRHARARGRHLRAVRHAGPYPGKA